MIALPDEFELWLDAQRNGTVSEVFYELVTRFTLCRKDALEEAAALFPQPHMEYFGTEIQDAIRSLK